MTKGTSALSRRKVRSVTSLRVYIYPLRHTMMVDIHNRKRQLERCLKKLQEFPISQKNKELREYYYLKAECVDKFGNQARARTTFTVDFPD